jgi:CRISPR type III-B/RAMP module RAMP protein Cmr1
MSTITATFRVTTPMFLGGADGKTAELRAASLKGVLRFWWRACAWSHFGGDLARIRDEEEKAFGGPGTGQSRVTIRMIDTRMPHQRVSATGIGGAGNRYLGYGLAQNGRDALPEGFDVAVTFGIRPAHEPVPLLVEAIEAMGSLGGLGARSRRGYGSLSLQAINGVTPQRLNDLLRAFLPREPSGLPDYTAFSPGTRILVGPPGRPMSLLDRLGQRYKEFRNTLTDDKKIVRNSGPGHPGRIAFGLPLHLQHEVVQPAADITRRASPLFFHIHQTGDQAVPVVAFLPARFLPERAEVVVRHRNQRPADPAVLYEPVHAFLDHLAGGREFRFTEVPRE